MKYYSAIQKSEIMEFSDKWMELKKILLREVTRPRKTNVECSLSSEVPSSKSVDMSKLPKITTGTIKVKMDHSGSLERKIAGYR